MFKVVRIALLAAAALTIATSLEATPIHFIGTFTPDVSAGVVLDDNGDWYSFNHDLTLPIDGTTNTLTAYIDNVLTPGEDYDSSTDLLTDGTLTLNFADCDHLCENGQFNLSLGGLLSAQGIQQTVTVNTFGSQFDLTLITNEGILSVLMTRTNAAGSATFLGSTLDVTGDRGLIQTLDVPLDTIPAPEPASLVLLGTGLIGAAAGARRVGKKQPSAVSHQPSAK